MAVDNGTQEIYAGDTVDMRAYIKGDGGNPLVLDGSTTEFELFRSLRTSPIVRKTMGNGVSLDVDDNGEVFVLIKLERADTLFPMGEYPWRIRITDSQGRSKVVSFGIFAIVR